jgi:hypothetical protein
MIDGDATQTAAGDESKGESSNPFEIGENYSYK